MTRIKHNTYTVDTGQAEYIHTSKQYSSTISHPRDSYHWCLGGFLNFRRWSSITGSHSNQNPWCRQKLIYTPIFTHHIRSWLLCTPAILLLSNKGITKQVRSPIRYNSKQLPEEYICVVHTHMLCTKYACYAESSINMWKKYEIYLPLARN